MASEAGETKETLDAGQRNDSSSMRDLLRKTVTNTVRSVGGDERIRQVVQSVVKEETVQSIVNSKMAKDAVGYAVRTLDTLKDEVVSMAGRQMNDFLERIDLGKELQKILTTLSLEVRAEVRFIPNDKRVVKPEVKSKMSIKKVDKKEKAKSSSKASEKSTSTRASSKSAKSTKAKSAPKKRATAKTKNAVKTSARTTASKATKAASRKPRTTRSKTKTSS